MPVLIADSWGESVRRLGAEDQGRATDFIGKFLQDPRNPGIRLKKPESMKDPDIWSGRITDDLRAIVYNGEGIYALLFAAHHDAAYKWARNRTVRRDTMTGAIQVIDLPDAVDYTPDAPRGMEAPPLVFAGCSDAYLLALGVPDVWLPVVRYVRDVEKVLGFLGKLPEEVVERLLMVATGEVVAPPEPAAAPRPALGNPDTLRRFIVVENDDDLAKALLAPLHRWITFLHPSQRLLAEGSFNGPVKVTGSAGTGKTVVAMHRARHLARQGKRVFFTTYVTTLCRILERNLGLLCGPGELQNIKVNTVVSQARRIVAKVDKGIGLIEDAELAGILERCRQAQGCPFDARFVAAEWQQVVQAQGITSWDAYRNARRTGRATRLDVKERKPLWTVFQGVFDAMRDRNGLDAQGMCRRAAELLQTGRIESPFDAVIVDETQDLQPRQIAFLHALAGDGPDRLMLAGDGGQRIYARASSLRSLGIEVRGRSHVLRINYRTTEEIRHTADRLLGEESDDLDGGRECRNGTRSLVHGPLPTVKGFATTEQETEFLAARIANYLEAGVAPEEVAVFVRSNSAAKGLAQSLKDAGLRCHVLDENGTAPDGFVNVGNMHRAKGLEFKIVFVANATNTALPQPEALRNALDESDRSAVVEQERQLLYVSLTRARDELYVTWSGKPSPFVADLPKAAPQNQPRPGDR
ncbi:MAG TPA: 3'-5' exonuclease [Armatimonadota bacterium]|jgi:superfamily I DNA/RNA helicase